MKTIHKYPVPLDGQLIEMPKGARILKIDAAEWARDHHPGNAPWIVPSVYLWTMVDTESPSTYRRVNVVVTGGALDCDEGEYIATVQLDRGNLVLHFFDCGEV